MAGSKKTKAASDTAEGGGSRKKARGGPTKKAATAGQERPAIPVSVLSGFLGSGKTSLLQHILTSKDHKLKIAVIVNDYAALNVDGQAIRKTTTEKREAVVELENGCICCTLRGDLIREINRIQETKQFDYVLIESTGIAEPQQVAESFCVDPETLALAFDDERMLLNSARLDTCVTVVDALHFPDYMASLDRFKDRFQDGLSEADKEQEGEKNIAELMVEQVEFSNVIVLNKVDLVSASQLESAKALIEALNPKAQVVTACHGRIDPQRILNTGLFNMKEADESRGWLVSLQDGVVSSHGEADEYGVTSFVYRKQHAPFHPHRLHTFLKQFFVFAEDWSSTCRNNGSNLAAEPPNNDDEQLQKRYGTIFRSKGTCWIAGRDDYEFEWHQVGRIVQLSPTEPWYCVEGNGTEEQGENQAEGSLEEEVSAVNAQSEFGDRRQEVVFIGTNLRQTAIEEALNGCLLTEEELANHHVTGLPQGAYVDPLLPIAVECADVQSVFVIARPGQDQHFRLYPTFSLTLYNCALNIVSNDDDDITGQIHSVKVWMDRTDDVRRGVLLATLRPGVVEQHATSLTLVPWGADTTTTPRLRVEVVPSSRARKGATCGKSPAAWMMACEVHVIGRVEPLPYAPNNGDDDDDDENEEEAGMENEEEGGCEAGHGHCT